MLRMDIKTISWMRRVFFGALLAVLCCQSVVAVDLSRRPAAATPRPATTRRMLEPAFERAGTTPGIEIWRIENFKPVKYPQKDYGKFYTGDSYIVLNTKEKNGVFSWDIHFWLGKETSQDEAGSAAILTVALDDQLGGAPVQYREVQEHESELFLSHFKSGVRYLPGGVTSGFTHVDPNHVEKRLFQVKGRRNIRVKQVDLTIASMNKGDCFILDVGKDIYVYVGAKSRRTEKLKAISAANQIRDQDHAGRAQVHIIEEYSSEADVREFFTVLGSGSPQDVPDESTSDTDDNFETKEANIATLYRISDASGKLKVETIGQKPLKQAMLDTNDCFILDTGNANIFVWIGKKCNKKEKDHSMIKAQEFLTSKNYPIWTHVERVIEGAEPTIFRQYFQTWKAPEELHTRLIRSVPVKKAPSPLDAKSGGEVQEFMPDNGNGDVEIFRVENFEMKPVARENYGKFFGGDSYLVKYHTTNDKWIIYIWQGNNSTLDEKAASAIHAVELDNQMAGKAIQIRVTQDHEPKHFLHIFKGKLITFLGGHESGFKNIKEHDTYREGEARMYRIRGTNNENVRASELPARAKSLQSDDVFIVENTRSNWIWIGKKADEVEKKLAKGFATILIPNVTPVVIEEGKEPEPFWTALGGQTSYNEGFENSSSLTLDPRLIHVYIRSSGKVKYEEITNFTQDDLFEDDVMILDSGFAIFVWIGHGASEEEKREALTKVAKAYMRNNNREAAILVVVKQDEEPEAFTSVFPSWKANLSMPSYSQAKHMFQK